MKIKNYLKFTISCFIAFLFITGCSSPSADTASSSTEDSTTQMAPPADMNAVKAEIQTIENAFAAAYNARDAKAVAAFYSEDALSLNNNGPILRGNAAILKDQEEIFAKPSKGLTNSYEVMDVYGDANTVTEIGKIINKDATGKVAYQGKYMAVWEKRDGKYICVSDIANDDSKEK